MAVVTYHNYSGSDPLKVSSIPLERYNSYVVGQQCTIVMVCEYTKVSDSLKPLGVAITHAEHAYRAGMGGPEIPGTPVMP